MASVHAERLSIPAQTYKALLDGISPLDEPSAQAAERLAQWDGTMDKELVAPTIYSAFRLRFHRATARHLLGPFADEIFSATGRGGMVFLIQFSNLVLTLVSDRDTSLLPSGTDWSSLAARALSDGVDDLRKRLGNDMESWHWGRVHHTKPRHTLSDVLPELSGHLDPPSVPMGGDGDTPQAASYSPLDPFVMTGMSVARYVFDLGDWNNSAWVTPLGASGHPGSPHYSDQVPIWGEVQLIPMLYDWDRIAAESESRQHLTPG
jgi:penicillin amidase